MSTHPMRWVVIKAAVDDWGFAINCMGDSLLVHGARAQLTSLAGIALSRVSQ